MIVPQRFRANVGGFDGGALVTTDVLFRAEGLTKTYPGVRANDAVSFDARPGEIHALLGENGAGKSTLVKMIYGLVRPDAGTMTLGGRPYAPADPLSLIHI